MSKPIRVALLGCGTVGTEVVRLMTEQADDLEARVGAPLELVGIAVRRPERHPDVPQELLTTDAQALIDKDIDVVVEVIGGIDPVQGWLERALEAGASVVSANKVLIAEAGVALHEIAERSGADLYYEAAVAGAIPLIRPLRESLAGDSVQRVMGIVNGTTNFILSRMDETGSSFTEALAEATELGYAEADAYEAMCSDRAYRAAMGADAARAAMIRGCRAVGGRRTPQRRPPPQQARRVRRTRHARRPPGRPGCRRSRHRGRRPPRQAASSTPPSRHRRARRARSTRRDPARRRACRPRRTVRGSVPPPRAR